jgi:hypothetical protein
VDAMRNQAMTQAEEADEEILSYDISDAANTEQNGFTLAYCTNYWHSCELPQ